ncbi:MAG: hypothetical protein NT165_00370 [Candidatus Falkowbacteria bacterium]|nr:hypothetical protein [Candidatus Falkowbacteria bacterium]
MSDKNKNFIYWPVFTSIFLVVFLLILFWRFLVSQAPKINYRAIPIPKENGIIRQSLGLKEIGLIESWMTFDYLNKSFNLPGDYLKVALGIQDKRYPFITIDHYSRLRKISNAAALQLTKQSVANYFPQQ